MFRIVDESSGALELVPMYDKDHRAFLVVILKVTFGVDAMGRAVVLDASQRSAVDLADSYNSADAARSSISRPSQLFLNKPGTDVVLLGHAHPPGRPVTHVDVGLRAGALHKVVRAHGLRVWQMGTLGGLKPGPAQPIREPVPLIYELAWGGQDLSDPAKPVGEPTNYVGRGVAASPRALVHQPAAQLEYPDRPVGGGSGNIAAAFNPIHRHWQPRCRFAGTFDEAWAESRMPLLPVDFDDRYHVSVAVDQWSPTPMRGDEPFELTSATPEGTWRFQLPRLAPGFAIEQLGQRTDLRTHLDTILVDADRHRVELTWRAAAPAPPKLEMIDSVMVLEKRVI